MTVQFRMPSLGADMEAGTLVEWLKKPGDRIERGEPIAVVETQKGAIDVECYQPGRLLRTLVDKGASVPVGTPLAELQEYNGGEAAAPAAEATPAAPAVPPPEVPPLAPAAAPAPTPGPHAGASPAARRLAKERGIDLSTVTGSGPGGAITSDDIEAASAATPAHGALDVAAMRKAIGAAMARSKREIPHYYLAQEVDLTAARHWLSDVNAAREPGQRLLMAALFLKATAMALARHPNLNGFWIDGAFRPSDAVHLGMAVAIRGGGLIAPAIHDSDKLPLDELMRRLQDNVTRARAGRLRSSELADATATVSSLGERGVDSLLGVISPPQVALIGFGRPAPKPWVVGDALEPREIVTVTLAADHRTSDGQRGAQFLLEIDQRLQQPEAL
jgi:pyruvate dehydrogenase E2 component (dihydrolipoamide acetyltransferase)